MTFNLLSRRSSVPGHVPTTSQLQLGELAVNTNDGLLYFVQNSSTTGVSMVALGTTPRTANAFTTNTTISVTGAATGASFIRYSNATYFDGSGNLQNATTNVLRPQYSSPITNYIFNNTGVGAIAGTPGTYPTSWLISQNTGLVYNIVGTGIDTSGIPYVDISVVGTATAGQINIIFEGGSAAPASYNQTWTMSMYCQLTSGSLTNFTGSKFVIYENNSSASHLTFGQSGFLATPTSAALASQRVTYTYTTTQAATAYVQPLLQLNLAAGSVNFTLRIGAPQLEISSIANAWVPTYGSIATVAGTQTGYIFEGMSTNYINNPLLLGAIANSTAPTQTQLGAITGNMGLTTTIVGSGTENGIPYFDFSLSGTVSNPSAYWWYLLLGTSAPISPGQVCTLSVYAELRSGSWANTTAFDAMVYFNTVGNGYTGGTGGVVEYFSSTLPYPTNASLSSQRYVFTTPAAPATTAYAQPYLAIFLLNGTTVNFTLRVGAPQLEIGSTATSLILPPAGTQAVTTRFPDISFNGAAQFFRSSNATYFDVNNTLQTVPANIERPLFVNSVQTGWLIENTSTNWIRNSTMIGATAGTPGILPSYWTNGIGIGITPNVVGTGTESGIPYLDIQLSGTAVAGNNGLFFDATTAIPAVFGQTWNASAYVRLTAGSLANVTAITFGFYELNGSGTFTVGGNNGSIVPTGSALVGQRFSGQYTISNSATAYVQPQFRLYASAGLLNATFRIGAPQMELGSTATSFIPTYGAAATRAADITSYASNGATIGASATIPTTLKASGVTAGTYNTLTVNAQGLITSATNLPYTPITNNGQIWTQNSLPSYDSWTGITYGNGLFVAMGAASANAATSVDGVTWTHRTLPYSDNWVNVAYGNGVFVTVGQGSANSITSIDGINWKSNISAMPNTGHWVVDFLNGIFVAVNYNTTNQVATSTNGVFWTLGTLPASTTWVNSAFGNNTYATIAYNSNIVATSTNATTWTQRTLPATANWNAIAYGNGNFVVVGQGTANVATSSDGITWTSHTSAMPAAYSWDSLIYTGSLFVAFPYNAAICATSTDGITWTSQSLPVYANWYNVAYGNGIIVGLPVVNNVVVTSTSVTTSQLPISGGTMTGTLAITAPTWTTVTNATLSGGLSVNTRSASIYYGNVNISANTSTTYGVYLNLNSANTAASQIVHYTILANAVPISKWNVYSDQTAQTGNSAGCNFDIYAYPDYTNPSSVPTGLNLISLSRSGTMTVPTLNATNATVSTITLTNPLSITLTGVLTGSGTFSGSNTTIATTFSDSLITAGTYETISVNAQGVVTASIAGRQALTSPLNLYVSSSGNDSNNGLTSGTAFATLQAAWNKIMTKYNLNGQSVTVNVANGTYAGVIVSGRPVGFTSSSYSYINFVGNTSSPTSCVISTSSLGGCFVSQIGANINVAGFSLTNTAYSGLLAQNSGIININGNMNFGTCVYYHMQASMSGQILIGSSYSISGGAYNHLYASINSTIQTTTSGTWTIVGSINFSQEFALVYMNSNIVSSGWTQAGAGTVTGTRYIVQAGIISTGGGGANYFPGNVAGSIYNGGFGTYS